MHSGGTGRVRPVVLSALPPLHPDAAAYLGPEVEFRVASDPSAETIMAEGRDAVALIGRGGTQVGGDVYDALEGLLVVVASGSGADCFDVPAATTRGIPVLNNPGRIVGVPEYVMSVIPLLSKRLLEVDRAMRRGETWPSREQFNGREVSGRTLGVIGFGHLGREVARRAQIGLNVRVAAHDPFVPSEQFAAANVERIDDLHELIAWADVVTVHVPLSAGTRGLVGRAEFAAMKPETIFINASRGPVVEESALISALQSGAIAAAAIDVWDPEPPAADHPLFELDNVLVTPHMAGVTSESRAAGARQIAETVLSALRGEPPTNILNPSAWPPARLGRAQFPLASAPR